MKSLIQVTMRHRLILHYVPTSHRHGHDIAKIIRRETGMTTSITVVDNMELGIKVEFIESLMRKEISGVLLGFIAFILSFLDKLRSPN